MKTLLLTLGFCLIVALWAQTPSSSDEENQNSSGTWYMKATAADKEIPWTKLDFLSVTPITVKTLHEGSLEIKFTIPIRGQCREISTTLAKTDEPDKYIAYGGKRVVHIIKSQVKGHYILYCEGEIHGLQIRMAKLVGRKPEVNQQALEDFKKVAASKGLKTGSIFIPKQREACSRGSH